MWPVDLLAFLLKGFGKSLTKLLAGPAGDVDTSLSGREQQTVQVKKTNKKNNPRFTESPSKFCLPISKPLSRGLFFLRRGPPGLQTLGVLAVFFQEKDVREVSSRGIDGAYSPLPLTRTQGPVRCVDYKYNPLIIAGCMEDFNGRGKSRALNSNGGAARTHAGRLQVLLKRRHARISPPTPQPPSLPPCNLISCTNTGRAWVVCFGVSGVLCTLPYLCQHPQLPSPPQCWSPKKQKQTKKM